jgi:hypothetical protein
MPVTQMSDKDRTLPSLAEVKDQLFREPVPPVPEAVRSIGVKA